MSYVHNKQKLLTPHLRQNDKIQRHLISGVKKELRTKKWSYKNKQI